MQRYKHGDCKRNIKRPPEYNSWWNMIQRCENPRTKDYKYYGQRGIFVDARWRKSYKAFIEDMGRKPDPTYSLERIDNMDGYHIDNCRWATKQEQISNRRSITLKRYCKRGHLFRAQDHEWENNRLRRRCKRCRTLVRQFGGGL